MSGQERDLTEGAVLGHVRAVALPAALSLLFVTLYNVTDTFYAGMISTTAQAGLGLGAQVFFLIIAIGIGFRIGMSAFVGDAIGGGDGDGAARAAVQGILAAAVLTLVTMVGGFWGLPALIRAIGGEQDYVNEAVTFARLMLLAAPGFVLSNAFAGILTAQGNNVTQERAQGGAMLANIGLNPLFIWGVPGLWQGFGLNGIALATIAAQSGMLLFVAWRAMRSDVMQGTSWRDFVPDMARMFELLKQVGPAAGTVSVSVLAGVICQFFLRDFGEQVVAAYGVGLRLQQLLLLPVIGLTTALLPLTAQNRGADQPDRIRQAIQQVAAIAFGFVGLSIILIWLAAEPIARLFNDEDAVVSNVVAYLRVLSGALPFFAVVFIAQNVLQGFKRPLVPLFIGLWRQGLALLLLIWLFTGPLDMGPTGVWLALLVAAGSGAILSLIFLIRTVRRSDITLWSRKGEA